MTPSSEMKRPDLMYPMIDVLLGRSGGVPEGCCHPGRRTTWSWIDTLSETSRSFCASVSACSDRPVSHIELRRRASAVDQFEGDRIAAWVVEEPDPVPEQHRHHVQVDLVDQPVLERLPSDGRREDLEV